MKLILAVLLMGAVGCSEPGPGFKVSGIGKPVVKRAAYNCAMRVNGKCIEWHGPYTFTFEYWKSLQKSGQVDGLGNDSRPHPDGLINYFGTLCSGVGGGISCPGRFERAIQISNTGKCVEYSCTVGELRGSI